MRKRRKQNLDVPLGTPAEQVEEEFRISTIPDEFYGGKNPEIYTTAKKNDSLSREIVVPKEEPKVPVMSETAPVLPTNTAKQLEKPKEKKRIWMYVGIGGLLLIVITIYVLFTSGVFRPTPEQGTLTPSVPVVTPVPPDNDPEPQVDPEPVIPTSSEPIIEEPTTTLDLGNLPIVFPRLNNTESVDLDGDQLTDAAEAVFKTDPGKWDTDEDGYYDGQELSNLYNPTGFAPVRLVDSALVRSYRNPAWGYQLYYPDSWIISTVDSDSKELIISSIFADYISVYVRTRGEGQSLTAWLADNSEEDIRQYRVRQNRFNTPVLVRSDGLVGLVEDGETLYVVVYYPDTSDDVAYRAVMNVVLESMTVAGNETSIPGQSIIPPSTTTTAVLQ